MADKLRLGPEIRQLKLGQSFTNPRSNAFHTIRYDFKPASVDINKMATVDVGNNNQVTVTVPHLDGAGVPQTLFKGSQRPYQKECVLIIDRITGAITLEKLSSNIQVKKTRAETYKPPSTSNHSTTGSSAPSQRPLTPVEPPAITQRTSSKTKVASGSRRTPTASVGLIPKHSPLHASPSHHPSPSHGPPPPKLDRHEPVGQSTLASLPMIGLDDGPDTISVNVKSPEHHSDAENGIGILSDSSSSSSSDSGSSDSDSDPDELQLQLRNNEPIRPTNGKSPTVSLPPPPSNNHLSVPDRLLNEDLCLSESATDDSD